MNQDLFITLLKNPENVLPEHIADLKEIIELYPYFVQPRLMLVKVQKSTNSIHFEHSLKEAALQSFNRRWLYYYIFPEKKLSVEPYRREHVGKSSGDYFDMIDSLERNGTDTKQSLKLLAERLKAAREVVNSSEKSNKKPESESAITIEEKTEVKQTTVLHIITKDAPVQYPGFELEISETNAKKCIREKKYSEAIEILKKLNLNNPKKSVYFADQIRFLEKVVSNSKK